MADENRRATETPESCGKATTVRRNPIRKARVSNLWILNDKISSQNPSQVPSSSSSPSSPSNNLPQNIKVFLRIRPSSPALRRGRTERKNKIEQCIDINDDQSVTVTAPLVEQKRRRSTEVFGGFAFVFSGDSSQKEVFDKTVMPLVEEFVRGRSSMVVALGPTGSGKTHTVFGRRSDPGVLNLGIRAIFQREEMEKSDMRISMFEICSERGRGERIVDLMGDGAELFLQQWTVKGLKEIKVTGFAEAEAAIDGGRMRRSTASTHSNCVSSRSQCIISLKNANSGAMFTIADLAGSEKQKRTGNQGARLVESGFINNTLMVFGQCLRALLEHQKNPGKPLQKHCQNSMLTRYLRDYLEGRKQMFLILTVKPGEEDYPDTSSLLRQASPLMKITFRPPDPLPRLPPPPPTKRRQISDLPVPEIPKRMKITCAEAKVENSSRCAICEEKERENMLMRKLSRSLLTLSRKYKERAEAAQKESFSFRARLKEEEVRNSELLCVLEDMKMKTNTNTNTQRSNGEVTNELQPNGGGVIDQTEEILSWENQTKENLKEEESMEKLKCEPKKPKRRLVRAASLLVNGVHGLGLDDEIGERKKRASPPPVKNAQLLKFLRPNLYS